MRRRRAMLRLQAVAVAVLSLATLSASTLADSGNSDPRRIAHDGASSTVAQAMTSPGLDGLSYPSPAFNPCNLNAKLEPCHQPTPEELVKKMQEGELKPLQEKKDLHTLEQRVPPVGTPSNPAAPRP